MRYPSSLTTNSSPHHLILVLVTFVSVSITLSNSTYSPDPQPGKETLIIVDKTNNIASFKQSHSKFIKLIEDLGHTLNIKSADDTTLKISKYGEFSFSNVILLCPQTDVFRGTTNAKDILEHVDAGGNLMIVGSHAPGSIISELANEVGFEFKETSAKREYANTKLNDIFYIIGDKSKFPSTSFSYSGTQLKMLKSELNLEILTNNAPVDDIRPSSSGKFLTNVLIGTMQARNNGRVIVTGSEEFFSNKAFEASKLANQHLTNELIRWLSKEKSLLRFGEVSHRKLNTVDTAPSTDIAYQTNFEGYTIMDDLEYTIKIELYENGKWNPYSGDDVQLEFVRIDPFVRQTMKHQADGTYIARFKVPDVYGVYKFQVDYKREGLTYLFSSTQVSVRPLRHNEYERYIYSALPYYLSAFLMMVYLYIFSYVYLYQQKEKSNNK